MRCDPAGFFDEIEKDHGIGRAEFLSFLRETYGLRNIESITRLYGYCDLNLKIRADGQSRFLKVHTAEKPESLRAVVDRLAYMESRGFPLAHLHGDKSGDEMPLLHGMPCIMQDFDTARHTGDFRLTEKLAFEMGRTLGRLHKYGADYDPAGKKAFSAGTAWSPDRFADVLAHYETIRDKLRPDLLPIIDRLAQAWKDGAAARAACRRGFIHGDFHAWNSKARRGQVTSVFDFADATYSWYAADVGRALRYLFLEKKDRKLMTPFMAGYESVFPLTAVERAQIPFFMQAMAATGLVENMRDFDAYQGHSAQALRTLNSPAAAREIRHYLAPAVIP